MSDTEIEIQVGVEKIEPLLSLLESDGDFQYENHQIDQYFTPAHRDFRKERPLTEWLRLRNSSGKGSITYKKWIPDEEGKTHHCDEYETGLEDMGQATKIFGAINMEPVCTVDKVRKVWNYKDYEVAVDKVSGIGDFVELEYKGDRDASESLEIAKEMIKLLKDLGCGEIKRSFQGYAFIAAFPDEAEWEIQ